MAERWRINPNFFNPSRELDEMRRRFEDDIIRPAIRAVWEHLPREKTGWSPDIDAYETDDAFVVRIELPAVSQDEVELSITENELTVRGERKPESDIGEEQYRRREIATGGFHRAVALPPGLNTDEAEATYQAGVLRVVIAKDTSSRPKKIDIQPG